MEKHPHVPQMPSNKYVDTKLMSPHSIVPTKENRYDPYYNITASDRTENRLEDSIGNVNMFNTGLSFTVPEGYYLEINQSPELLQTGYFMTSPIIVSPRNTEELIIPLYKFREDEDLPLPFIVAQAIVRQQCSMIIGGNARASAGIYTPIEDDVGCRSSRLSKRRTQFY